MIHWFVKANESRPSLIGNVCALKNAAKPLEETYDCLLSMMSSSDTKRVMKLETEKYTSL